MAALAGAGIAFASAVASADISADTSADTVPLVPEAITSFERCTIGGRGASVPAECATVEVPLDPAGPAGETLGVAVARLRATGRGGEPDPVVLIAGGPGQSARDAFPAVGSAFRHLNRDRDILLIDQRGTGASRSLDCPAGADPGAFEDAALADEARRAASGCLATLDADPRLFTTSVAVADLERVRDALGIDAWNLYGVSYGTRVAIHYARRHPERVRSMILDAVLPPGTPLGPDIAPLAQRALDLILARCLAEAGCSDAFPAIDERTRAFVASLATAPRSVTWEDIADGSLVTETFSRRELAVTLRLLAYSAFGASVLPSMLDDAIRHGHLAPLARQAALQSRNLDETLATGMHYAVICTEDVPLIDLAAARRRAVDTFLGAEPLEAIVAACEPWPRGRIDEDFHAPLALELPTLVLSGEADPVTPPDYGTRAAAMFSPSRHIVDAGQGHMQAPLGCMPSVMAAFVATLDPDGLSLDCLERLAPPPFFVDANGPLP